MMIIMIITLIMITVQYITDTCKTYRLCMHFTLYACVLDLMHGMLMFV